MKYEGVMDPGDIRASLSRMGAVFADFGAVAVSSAVALAGDYLLRQLLAQCAFGAVRLTAGALALASLSRLNDSPSQARWQWRFRRTRDPRNRGARGRSLGDSTPGRWRLRADHLLDARPSPHLKTLEFRVADVCLTVDEVVLIAGLTRPLSRACHDERSRGRSVESVRPELLRAASWRPPGSDSTEI